MLGGLFFPSFPSTPFPSIIAFSGLLVMGGRDLTPSRLSGPTYFKIWSMSCRSIVELAVLRTSLIQVCTVAPVCILVTLEYLQCKLN